MAPILLLFALPFFKWEGVARMGNELKLYDYDDKEPKA